MPSLPEITPEAVIDERSRAYDSVFSSPDGQRVLADLMQRGRVFDTTFDPDPHVSSFNEGFRGCVVYILEQMRFARTSPSAYLEQRLKFFTQHDRDPQ